VRRAVQAIRRHGPAAWRPQRGGDPDDRRRDPSPPGDENLVTAAPPPIASTGERVLVVDDEPDIVALVAYHLAKNGFRVSTASSGSEALSIARNERPAIVVLDLMLPGMSGFEVLEQLRAAE